MASVAVVLEKVIPVTALEVDGGAVLAGGRATKPKVRDCGRYSH